MDHDKKRKEKSWTILVIGDKERIRSFEITKTFIVIPLVIVLGLLIGTGIFAAWQFHDRAQTPLQMELAYKLKSTRNTLKTIKQENSDLMTRVQDLEGQLTLAQQNQNTLEIIRQENSNLKARVQTLKDQLASAEKKLKKTLTAKTSPPADTVVDKPYMVAVENLKTSFDRINNACIFSFTLKNKKEDNVTISGRSFVVLKPDSADSESWRVYPKFTLKNGRPQNFRRGERFSIARFKTMKGKFRKIPIQDSYDSITVFIFSNDGALILEEEIDLKNAMEGNR
ncbi:MAG: hypothetical protein IMF10_08690 [Proteobacteria bacterium]|nr:hypothetical protein [Pseudomonadota bacterium]